MKLERIELEEMHGSDMLELLAERVKYIIDNSDADAGLLSTAVLVWKHLLEEWNCDYASPVDAMYDLEMNPHVSAVAFVRYDLEDGELGVYIAYAPDPAVIQFTTGKRAEMYFNDNVPPSDRVVIATDLSKSDTVARIDYEWRRYQNGERSWLDQTK